MHIAYGRILSQRRSTSGRVLAPAVVPGTWTFTWAHDGTDVAALLCGRLTLRAEGEPDKTEHDGCAGGGAAFSRQMSCRAAVTLRFYSNLANVRSLRRNIGTLA